MTWPVVLQNLLINGTAMINAFMVGSLDERYLSGVMLANTVFIVQQLVIFGLQSGSSVLIAQYHGKGDKYTINRIMGINYRLSLIVSFAAVFALTVFPDGIYGLMTNDPDLIS
ncbi:MAG: MATE family efflux transporter, partial [Defluviitaleaceae bacterium]|nr:MATE family efflux transporter [Defluviitaleaceae bacterium]